MNPSNKNNDLLIYNQDDIKLEKPENVEIKKKRICKFNKQFITLRNSLNLNKISRKCQFDSMLKKVKAKVYKVIHDSLKRCYLNKYQLFRIPQAFITNIKIECNKKYLNETILQIYKEFEIIKSFNELLEENVLKEEKKNVCEKFLELTFEEIYEYYVTSKRYTEDKEKIAKKEGKEYSILFEFIADNFIDYYKSSKGNKPKKNSQTKNYGDKKTVFRIFNG